MEKRRDVGRQKGMGCARTDKPFALEIGQAPSLSMRACMCVCECLIIVPESKES